MTNLVIDLNYPSNLHFAIRACHNSLFHLMKIEMMYESELNEIHNYHYGQTHQFVVIKCHF